MAAAVVQNDQAAEDNNISYSTYTVIPAGQVGIIDLYRHLSTDALTINFRCRPMQTFWFGTMLVFTGRKGFIIHGLNFTIMKAKHILVGMIAAAAVGALVGTLFAPDKGTETRKKIRDTADDLVNKVKKGLRKNSATGEMEVG